MTTKPIARRFDTGSTTEAIFSDEDSEVKRAERREFCGTYISKMTMRGKRKIERAACGEFSCPRCGGKRAHEFKQYMLDTLKKQEVVMSRLPHAELAATLRSLSGRVTSSQYRHYTMQDDTSIIFVTTSAANLIAKLPDPQLVTQQVVNKLDWFTIQNTKPGCKIRGSLGVPKPAPVKSSTEKRERVTMAGIAYDNRTAQQALIHEAEMRALAATMELDPHSLEEIVHCMKIRDKVTFTYLDMLKVKYHTTYAHDSDYVSTIDWIVDNYDDMLVAVEEGYIPQARLNRLMSTLSQERLDRIAFCQSIKPPPVEYVEYPNGPPI